MYQVRMMLTVPTEMIDALRRREFRVDSWLGWQNWLAAARRRRGPHFSCVFRRRLQLPLPAASRRRLCRRRCLWVAAAAFLWPLAVRPRAFRRAPASFRWKFVSRFPPVTWKFSTRNFFTFRRAIFTRRNFQNNFQRELKIFVLSRKFSTWNFYKIFELRVFIKFSSCNL